LNSIEQQKCIERDFIARLLDKLYDLLNEAYYTTPPYIASRSLIKRSLDLVHSTRVSLYKS
jgi:hypothetical protein